ncbi:MAG: HlyD family secretion protein [Burkholderiaceae bacterium]
MDDEPASVTGRVTDDGRFQVNVSVSVDPTRPWPPPGAPRGDDDTHDDHGDHDGDRPDGAGRNNGKDGKDGKEDKPNGNGKTPLYKRPVVVGLALLVLLLLILAGIAWWRHAQTHASTDDAFIDGQVTNVAPQASGRVTKLYVTDNQHVKAGQPLIDIDARDVEVKVEQAKAQLANAESQLAAARAQVAVRQADAQQAGAGNRQIDATLAKAEQDLKRYRKVDPGAVSQQQIDAAVANVRSLRAQRDATGQNRQAAQAAVKAAQAQVQTAEAAVKVARANIDAAQLQLSYTHLTAPIAGRVTKRSVELGSYVDAGHPVMAIVSDDLWVTANYKETELARMHPGEDVQIVIDAYPDVTFHGKVDSIQRATGSYFSTLPAENATGNYVKVVQRVPVKIVFDDKRIGDYLIAPGMSAVPDVQFPDR